MKIEQLLLLAMSNNEQHGCFLLSASRERKVQANNNNNRLSQCRVKDADEGYCILRPFTKDSEKNKSNRNISSLCLLEENTSETMRRVRSTPNLLEIPTSLRSRKRSDDSAVGDSSPEESELSDKLSVSSLDYSKSIERDTQSLFSPQVVTHIKTSGEEMKSLSSPPKGLLRPPSVVVSDHDLCSEGEFLTLDDLDAEYNRSQNMSRRLSDCSTCSSLSYSDPDFMNPQIEEDEEVGKKISRWKTVKTIFHQLTPFLLNYKNTTRPWVQLAGHQGNFKPGEQQGTILKKFCDREKEAFEQLMNDALRPFVPQYYNVVKDDAGNEFIQLEDLLGRFHNPCVMDCKLGVRTYLEEELLKAKEKPKLRKDMYEKMCQIDRAAPTAEEHQLHGVTKPRYMVWRETISTTATFGFRIEGMRKSDGFSSKDFKTTKSEEQVQNAFKSFVSGTPGAVSQYLSRLQELKVALKESKFFATHEIIGSSLLFIHDDSQASVWMIDFAKTCRVPENVSPISHDRPWTVGNHEDGYLLGLSNLIKIFTNISQDNP